MFKKICTLTILSLVAMSSFLAAIEYDIQDIGTLQTRSSQAIALNNKGQILGWFNVDGTNNGKHFFFRNRDGVFYEIPGKEPSTALAINWQFLTDEGKVYGTYEVSTTSRTLYLWDQQNGVVKLGVLPGKEVVAINNKGEVLIKSVTETINGRPITFPITWKNGVVKKLKGLEGNLGIESEETCGLGLNNNGDVVGQSRVYIIYKNNEYKTFNHAVLWKEGKCIDLHNGLPKSTDSAAFAINDIGGYCGRRAILRILN